MRYLNQPLMECVICAGPVPLLVKKKPGFLIISLYTKLIWTHGLFEVLIVEASLSKCRCKFISGTVIKAFLSLCNMKNKSDTHVCENIEFKSSQNYAHVQISLFCVAKSCE